MIRNRSPGSHSRRSIRPRSRTVVPALRSRAAHRSRAGARPCRPTSRRTRPRTPAPGTRQGPRSRCRASARGRRRSRCARAPRDRGAGEARSLDLFEDALGDRAELCVERRRVPRAEVVGCVSGEELLENIVDHGAARERVELDDRLGLVERLHAQEPLEEEAVGARRVRLEHGRAEGRRLVEPGADRRDRVRVLEDAVERGELARGPACAPVLVGSPATGASSWSSAVPSAWSSSSMRCRAPARSARGPDPRHRVSRRAGIGRSLARGCRSRWRRAAVRPGRTQPRGRTTTAAAAVRRPRRRGGSRGGGARAPRCGERELQRLLVRPAGAPGERQAGRGVERVALVVEQERVLARAAAGTSARSGRARRRRGSAGGGAG